MIPFNISPFSGGAFWTITCLLVCIHGIISLKANHPLIRNIVMIMISFVIVASVIGLPLFLILFLISVITFYCGFLLIRGSLDRSRNYISWACIGLVIFVLCFFKYSFFQSATNFIWEAVSNSFDSPKGARNHIFFVGVSYFCFKFIHFLIECYNKKIKELNFLTFINYTLFFPSFFSGPINRYEQFTEDIQAGGKVQFSQNVIPAGKRIISGLFKKIVLANSLLPYAIISMNFDDPSVDASQAIIGIYAYMFFIYFDFSGYTDMALGVATLVGIKLPENFNYPFFKRNLQQFWANWHMSLTSWLTDYIYWPLARKIRHVGKLKKRPVTISNICIIATFAVCGVWHGDGLNFLLWGIYHGIGLAILNIFISIEKKYFSMRWRRLLNQSRISYAVSTLITFQYVAFGFFLFGCDLNRQQQFFHLLSNTYIK